MGITLVEDKEYLVRKPLRDKLHNRVDKFINYGTKKLKIFIANLPPRSGTTFYSSEYLPIYLSETYKIKYDDILYMSYDYHLKSKYAYSQAFTSSLCGRHFKTIILDDPFDKYYSLDKNWCQKNLLRFEHLFCRLTPGYNCIFLFNTRFSLTEDTTAKIVQKYRPDCYIDEFYGNINDTTVFTKERLEEIKNNHLNDINKYYALFEPDILYIKLFYNQP